MIRSKTPSETPKASGSNHWPLILRFNRASFVRTAFKLSGWKIHHLGDSNRQAKPCEFLSRFGTRMRQKMGQGIL